MNLASLRQQISELGASFGAVSFAVHDYQGARSLDVEGGHWFHAASVIKVAILVALFKKAEQGEIRLEDPLHVRNRFQSIVDGSIFRIDRERDGDLEVHRRVGRTLKLSALARSMIVRSSNLATNLLLDLLGISTVQEILAAAQLEGVRLVRGVEDHIAFDRGLNNQMTACGAVALLRLICDEQFLGASSRQQIREILLAQEFNSMLPARLPTEVKVAHKTGEISTHCHDAGIIYCPGRLPYVVAIFTQSEPGVEQRSRAIAQMSLRIFEFLTR